MNTKRHSRQHHHRTDMVPGALLVLMSALSFAWTPASLARADSESALRLRDDARQTTDEPASEADRTGDRRRRSRRDREMGENLGRRPRWLHMDQEEREALVSFIREHFPDVAQELARLRDLDPERCERRLRRLRPDLRRLMEVMEINPERGRLLIEERRLEIRIRAYVKQYRKAKEKEVRLRIRHQLATAVTQRYNKRLERRALEIEDLEARIAALKAQLEEDAARRDDRIVAEIEAHLMRADNQSPPRAPDGEKLRGKRNRPWLTGEAQDQPADKP